MIVLEWLFLTISACDAAEPWQLGFQDAATPMMQGIIDLHHDIFFFLILILVFVLRILVRALWHFHYKKNPIPQRIVHGTTIEILRTIFPSIIPMFIAIPSFALLYSMDEVVVDPAITIKAIGHQWYRTYEYSDYNSSDEQSLTFDSYTIPEDDLELGQSRLLEVDNRVVVPAKTHLRIIVTSADVLHSWAVPSSGVNSEICGRNHAIEDTFSRKDYGSRVATQMPNPGKALLIPSPHEEASTSNFLRGAQRMVLHNIPVVHEVVLDGIPVPRHLEWDAISSPFYAAQQVHIAGEIEDPLTIFQLGELNGSLMFIAEKRFNNCTEPLYTRQIQFEVNCTPEADLPAKLYEIRKRELARFHLPDTK